VAVTTETPAPRKPGRPRGRTEQGRRTRILLYETAIRLFVEKGYQETTLRGIAASAGVSPALLYKYFPSKSAVVLELYDGLSADYAHQATEMKPGKWRERAVYALETSLSVLASHRSTLAALTPVLVGDPDHGLFSERTSFSRVRVQQVFIDAVSGSKDNLAADDAEALGRLLYVVHLLVLLWWLLDKSPNQVATRGLLAVARKLSHGVALALRFPRARAMTRHLDGLVGQALFGEPT
jgi:AcrR family transcriptional regulator